ncbi:MAG TPA: ABC transporter permease [Streptosporangiaceae bacterium]|jgi:peptide/nickel transport system permease protein
MNPGPFILKRLVGMVLTLLIASFVIFGSLYLAPGSPLAFLTRGRATAPGEMAALRRQYHLNESFPLQYWHWLTGVLHGNLGTSILYRESVWSLIEPRAVNTAFLVLFAGLMIVVIGLGVGTLAGLRPGWIDTSVMMTATAAMSVPAFVAAIVLVTIFAVNLNLLPVFGAGSGFVDRIYHLLLPAAALALANVAYVARLSRTSVRDARASEHTQTAISRGLPYRLIVRRHILRNAAIPMTTIIGLTVGGLIAGAVVIEEAFSLNGMGSYLVDSVGHKDFPVVQAISLIFVVAFIVINSLVDVLYTMLDPRVRARAAGE